MSISILLVVLAVVFFVLAGCNVTAKGRFQFQWFALACLTAAYLVGKG